MAWQRERCLGNRLSKQGILTGKGIKVGTGIARVPIYAHMIGSERVDTDENDTFWYLRSAFIEPENADGQQADEDKGQ